MTSKYGVFSKILFVAILMIVSTGTYAQSMTDNQVIQFVQQEQQKGSDQQTIITKLLPFFELLKEYDVSKDKIYDLFTQILDKYEFSEKEREKLFSIIDINT